MEKLMAASDTTVKKFNEEKLRTIERSKTIDDREITVKREMGNENKNDDLRTFIIKPTNNKPKRTMEEPGRNQNPQEHSRGGNRGSIER